MDDRDLKSCITDAVRVYQKGPDNLTIDQAYHLSRTHAYENQRLSKLLYLFMDIPLNEAERMISQNKTVEGLQQAITAREVRNELRNND